jgi:hypothetical protein
MQVLVSWVEGLGPRNAGTVFANVADAGARPPAVRAQAHVGHWQLGQPDLARQLPATTIAAGAPNGVARVVVDLGLASERRVRAVEYMPGDPRVVRAAFFTVQETGEWIGSWTPWHRVFELPEGLAYRLSAGMHVVAELHFQGASEPTVEQGTLGLFFANAPRRSPATDLMLQARTAFTAGAATKLRAETRLAADSTALALWPETAPGLTSVEVTARTADGGTEVLLFAKDPPADWPTPYVFAKPVNMRRGTTLSVTAHYAKAPPPGGLRLVVKRY